MDRPPYTPLNLRRIHERLRSLLPTRRERHVLVFIVVAVTLLLMREAAFVPVRIGWSSARSLVESDDELARLHAEAAEYHRAAKFFESEAGREYARKLGGSYLEEGERPVRIVPEPEREDDSTARRFWERVATREASAAASVRRNARILKRWAFDPPGEMQD